MKKVLGLGLLGVMAFATAGVAAEEEVAPSVYDKVWGALKFVDNDEAAFLQSLAVTGRLQGDAYYFDGGDDGLLRDATWRRFRIGGKATLFHNFTAHAEADINLNHAGTNRSYKRLTDVYAAWSPSKAFKLKAGKQSAGFTLDGATSSKKLITLQRSVVAGNIWFTTEYFTGVSGSGSASGWTYKLAGMSSSRDPEFGTFDSGWFAFASLGRDVSEHVNVRLDYVHNAPDYTGDVGTKKLRNLGSLVTKTEFDKLGFWTDLSVAEGIGSQSNLAGLELMPFWSFTDIWQAVFRYSMVHSTDGSGAKLGRYPKKISGRKYEDIHDFYLGLNCYLYGHKLKWQNGIEYNIGQNDVAGNDYRGWGVTSGFRISW